MEKRDELYAGKAKSVYLTDDPKKLVLYYRNDTSAFDGEKIDQLDRKGEVNNKFSAFIMQKLEEAGVPTHHEGLLSADESVVKRLEMFPIECVVRNIAAGSICKRLGVEEGIDLRVKLLEGHLLPLDPLYDLHPRCVLREPVRGVVPRKKPDRRQTHTYGKMKKVRVSFCP